MFQFLLCWNEASRRKTVESPRVHHRWCHPPLLNLCGGTDQSELRQTDRRTNRQTHTNTHTHTHTHSGEVEWRWHSERQRFGWYSQRRTVEVAGVVLRLQLRDELGLLSQQAVPVQLCEERVLLHLKGTSCGDEAKTKMMKRKRRGRGNRVRQMITDISI